jgi:ribose 5-phosphate isomerase RpiB
MTTPGDRKDERTRNDSRNGKRDDPINNPESGGGVMQIGIAAARTGLVLKVHLRNALRESVYEVWDFSPFDLIPEDDDMNVVCLGARVLAWDLLKDFLAADYVDAERRQRRLAKVIALEN